MKRFCCNSVFGDTVIDYVLHDPIQYESCTDLSDYEPSVNGIRNIVNAGIDSATPVYDFPDGVDNGLRMGVLRDMGATREEREIATKQLLNTTSKESAELKKEVESIIENQKQDDLDNLVTAKAQELTSKNTSASE